MAWHERAGAESGTGETNAFRRLLICELKFFGGGGALGAAFLFHVLGAIGDFVVDFFDFEREVKILGMLCVFFEERIAFGFQVVAFFLPGTGHSKHVIVPGNSVRHFWICR